MTSSMLKAARFVCAGPGIRDSLKALAGGRETERRPPDKGFRVTHQGERIL